MSSSVHIDHKGKVILILGEEPTHGLDDATLTAEAKYLINVTQIEHLYQVHTIVEATVSYLLMLQKYI